SLLREVNLREVLGPDPSQNQVAVLAGQLTHVETQLATIEEQLLAESDVVTLAKAAARLEARKKDLAEQLAAARQKAAAPRGEAWGECKTTMDLLSRPPAPPGTRLRLRSLLRRVVSEIWVLVVGRGRDRIAAAQ